MGSPSQIQQPDRDPPSIQQQNSPQIENPISNLEEITHQNGHQSPKTLGMSRIQEPERSDPTLEETQVIDDLDVDEHEDEILGNVFIPTTKINKGDLKRPKTIDRKVDNLLKYINFVRFKPVKTLDFDKYENLLKNLGLWDFVRLEFDDEIRADVIAQFIVSYDSVKRFCVVNGSRIYLSRPGFVTAFNLPLPVRKPKNKKEKVESAVEEAIDLDAEGKRVSDDCIKFLEDFVWTWVVLRGDDWVMPNEIKHWIGWFRDGYPGRVDWGGLFWFMVENELKQKDQLRKCYYASHLQYFIKSKTKEVFGEEVKKFVANDGIKEEGKLLSEEDNRQAEVTEMMSKELSEEDVVKAVANEGNIEVRLLSEEENKEVKVEGLQKDEDLVEEPHVVDQEVAEEGDLVSEIHENSSIELFASNAETNLMMGGPTMYGNGHKRAIDYEQDTSHFNGSKRMRTDLGWDQKTSDFGFCMGQLAQLMEEVKIMFEEKEQAYNESQQYFLRQLLEKDNYIESLQRSNHEVVLGEPVASNAETNLMMGGPTMYGNGHKRAIDYEQDTSHLDGSTRMRTDVGWDQKTSDFGFCMGQAAQLMEQVKTMYKEKEQAYNDLNESQQYLLRQLLLKDNEIESLVVQKKDVEKEQTYNDFNMSKQYLHRKLPQRDNYIESLQRSNHEVVQKKDAEIYRLERELGLFAELVNGYREALKENRRSFLEYRQRCQLPEEPIYKDAGPGGLVLSVTELEKQGQHQENEDRLFVTKHIALEKENMVSTEITALNKEDVPLKSPL